MSSLYRQINYRILKNAIFINQYKHICGQFSIKPRISGESVITDSFGAYNAKYLHTLSNLNINDICGHYKHWFVISDTTAHKRFKSKDRTVKEKEQTLINKLKELNEKESDDEDDEHNSIEVENDPDYVDGKPIGFEDIVTRVNAMRLDNVAKVAFKLTRNKVDEAFYDGLFRINGEKIMKKSEELNEEDVCDIIIGINKDNERMLDITRVVVKQIGYEITGSRAVYKVKLRKFNKLTVYNYPNGPYEGLQISEFNK